VNFGFGDLDDMTAALGNFVFKVAVAGDLERPPGSSSTRVTIRSVGVFIRDSFDFNDFQFLGFWDDATKRVSMVDPFLGEAVYNSSFRSWRSANGRGGDFLVLSDVKQTPLSKPDVLTIP
jgi:hypothetical protein